MKTQIQKLYFIRDNTFSQGDQVYSGHKGTGKKFVIYMTDYGKYAMNPATKEECEKLIKKIEKAAKGLTKFNWEIVPITDINLCNFYTEEAHEFYYKLQAEQKTLS